MTQIKYAKDRQEFAEQSNVSKLSNNSFREAMLNDIRLSACISTYNQMYRVDGDHLDDVLQDAFAQMIYDATENMTIEELEECFHWTFVGEAKNKE